MLGPFRLVEIHMVNEANTVMNAPSEIQGTGKLLTPSAFIFRYQNRRWRLTAPVKVQIITSQKLFRK